MVNLKLAFRDWFFYNLTILIKIMQNVIPKFRQSSIISKEEILLLYKYQWNVKRKKARRDILNISVYTNLKHTWYMCKYRVKQYLIVLKLDCVSINKILVMKFVTVRVSYNLNLMQSLSTHWNQQFIRYVFSKVIECLEQNIRKQIDCKRPLNTRQMNWVQKIQIEMRKYKAIEYFEI